MTKAARFALASAVVSVWLAALLGTGPAVADVPTTVCVFGPECFYRDTGSPVEKQYSFDLPPPEVLAGRVTGPWRLIAASGDPDGTEIVSSACVALNGTTVLKPNDFNQTVTHIVREIDLIQHNCLAVGLRSLPGSALSIRVVADILPPPAPQVDPVTSPTWESTQIVSGIALPGSTVEIAGGAAPASGPADPVTGEFSIEVPLSPSANGLSITQTDVFGLTSEATPVVIVRQVSQLTVAAGLDHLVLITGETGYVTFTVDAVATSGLPYSVDAAEWVEPISNGLSWYSDYPAGGWSASSPMAWVVNVGLTGVSAGAYTFGVSAYLSQAGIIQDQATAVVEVVVLDQAPSPQLEALGSDHDAVSPGTPTPVLFTTSLTGTCAAPDSLVLYRVPDEPLASMNDSGSAGDLVAGDNVYSCTVVLEEQVRGPVEFQAEAQWPGGTNAVSAPCSILVTSIPLGHCSDPAKVVVDPVSGYEMLSNEIIVGVVGGLSDEDVYALAALVDGTVVDAMPRLNLYVFEIPDDGDSGAVLSAIETLSGDPRVQSAAPNLVIHGFEVTPNDTRYSDQWALPNIRVDETWILARGRALVAVVDSGVDYGHPDLQGNVILSRDFHNGDDDPRDDNGHGTHVAGIIAASVNNGQGIAGASWGSKVLAVKVQGAEGGGYGWNIAAGIRRAADTGAKVINCSFGLRDNLFFWLTNWVWGMESAVNYAANTRGCLVVVAAGNDGDSVKQFPAAFPAAFAVGNTTQTDSRNGLSSYGDWVDIAAPGTGIWSTMPTYDVYMTQQYGYSKDYDSASGTSMAAPHISAVAALVWSLHPEWSAEQVRRRIEKTASPLPGLELGYGRVDAFEASFNGSFEMGSLEEWQTFGTVGSILNLGPLQPQDFNGHAKRMAYATTGPSGDQVSASFYQQFDVHSGVSQLDLAFDYNFVTEEYPEWVGTIYNDVLRISLSTPTGDIYDLATETVNTSAFVPISGIDFPGGDNTVGMTGWKTVEVTIPIIEGSGQYEIYITDAGDDIYDSVLLLDNVRFKH